jgi:hypothetical protein
MTAVCWPGAAESANISKPPHVQHEAELTQAVVRYVCDTRKWPVSSFTVQLRGLDGKLFVFWVLFKGEDFHSVGGGGKSFEALVNPASKHVEKELHFQ